MKIKFFAKWSPDIQKNIKKGILGLEINQKDIKKVGTALKQLNEKQLQKHRLIDLEINLNISYTKRTLDQNALMFSLYQILANEMNSNKEIGLNLVKYLDLYNNDLIELAPRIELKTPTSNLDSVKLIYRMIEEEKEIDENYTFLKVVLTSSHFNTKQMTEWIEMLFDRIAEIGLSIENSSQVAEYWKQHREFMDKNNIYIHDDKNNIQEYKKANPNCEACGKYIGGSMELGNLAHIKSVGAGGNSISSNFLHLCGNCHLLIQHQKGWQVFSEKFPHLKNKIENALINGALKFVEENIK